MRKGLELTYFSGDARGMLKRFESTEETLDKDPNSKKNEVTKHNRDYGLFDKNKLQAYWLKQCNKAEIEWHKGLDNSFTYR